MPKVISVKKKIVKPVEKKTTKPVAKPKAAPQVYKIPKQYVGELERNSAKARDLLIIFGKQKGAKALTAFVKKNKFLEKEYNKLIKEFELVEKKK